MFLTVASGTHPRPLPRGPHRLAREIIEASQRGRLLDAIAEVVAEKGYAAATVADGRVAELTDLEPVVLHIQLALVAGIVLPARL